MMVLMMMMMARGDAYDDDYAVDDAEDHGGS